MTAMSAASSVVASSFMPPSSLAFFPLGVSVVDPSLSRQPFEARDFAKPLLGGPCRRAAPTRAGRDVIHDPRLRRDCGAGADGQMLGHPYLPTHHNAVLE